MNQNHPSVNFSTHLWGNQCQWMVVLFIIKKISAKLQLNLFQLWCVAHFFIIVQINIFNRFLAQSQHILAIICPRKCSLMTAYQYLKFLAHFPVLRLSCMIQSRISQLKIYRKGYGYFMEYFLYIEKGMVILWSTFFQPFNL